MNQEELQEIKSLMDKYPRGNENYFSYPLRKNWKVGFTQSQYRKVLNHLSTLGEEPIAIHISFPENSDDSFLQIKKEIELASKTIGSKPKVNEVFFDSNVISIENAIDIFNILDSCFEIDYSGQISIQLNMNSLTEKELDELTDEGFNDFHFKIPTEFFTEEKISEVENLLNYLKENGGKLSTVTVLFGLENQTQQLTETILEKILNIDPIRIKLKPVSENNFDVESFFFIKEFVENKGWYFIGTDLLVKDSDEFIDGQNNGLLGLNGFEFRTNNTRYFLGFGKNSFSYLADVYIGGLESEKYQTELNADHFPVSLYYPMKLDEKIRRYVMVQLICSYVVFFPEFAEATKENFEDYFSDELEKLAPLIKDGLVEKMHDRFLITSKGELFLNHIVSKFDKFN